MAEVSSPVDYDETNGASEDENDDEMQHDEEGADDRDTTMLDGEIPNTALLPQSPDTPTDYSLFSNPPQLGLMRQRLFDVDDQIEMSLADFEAYFPFVDNVWRRRAPLSTEKDAKTTTETYWCRLRRPPGATQPRAPKPTPEGKQSRKKRAKQDVMCEMALKVVRDERTNTCLISRMVPPDTKHTHTLEYMDTQKRSAGIMDIARREAHRGFLPTSIHMKLWSEPDKMLEAGGKHLKVSDIRNVQYQWRQQHPHIILKAHTGFKASKGGRVPPKADVPAPMPNSTPTQSWPRAPQIAPPPPMLPPDTLQFPHEARPFLERYLFQRQAPSPKLTPHVTLTWASSLDSKISLMPGVRTALSGPETRSMAHFLRSRHDAILIGVRTAMADDPSLNCRLAGSGGHGGPEGFQQPRPIIIDPHARLHIRPEMNLLKAVSEHRARAPWIVVAPGALLHPTAVGILKAHGGEYLMINDFQPQQGLGLNWDGLFQILFKEGIRSLMVEGGGIVLSELLKPQYARLIDSVIITIAPTFLGKAGTPVCPDTSFDASSGQPLATRLREVTWQPMGAADVVFCGKFAQMPPTAVVQHLPPGVVTPHHQDQGQGQVQTNGILRGIEEFSRSETGAGGPPPQPPMSAGGGGGGGAGGPPATGNNDPSPRSTAGA